MAYVETGYSEDYVEGDFISGFLGVSDLEFYKSTINEFDPLKNGGEITTDFIESGVLNNLLLDVRPQTAESGGKRWFKFYARASVDILSVGIDISKVTDSQSEEVYLAVAGSNEELESDLDKANMRVYGGFIVASYDADTKTATADRELTEFVKVDDKVTFYDGSFLKVVTFEVESIDGFSVVFKNVNNTDITDLKASSTIILDSINSQGYIGLWIKQVIPPFTTPMENPLNSFSIGAWYDIK